MLSDTKSRLSTAKAGFAGKNLSLLFIALLFLQITTLAQAPDTLWTKTYGGNSSDGGSSVQQTNDSGYIITGSTSSFGAGNLDVYLVKTDLAGDTLWTKTYGAENGDAGFSVQQTSDGGYIITGTANAVAFSVHEVFLIKTDSSGDTLWTKIFTESSNSGGYSVQQTTDGGYIITGGTDFFGAGSNDVDVFLIKTDSSGDTLWTKTYGGNSSDVGFSVQQTNDGGYIITGSTYSFGAGSMDVFLIKTDSSGDTLWTRTFGGSELDWGNSVQQTNDGGYIITGSTYSFGAGLSAVWVIKTDENGDTLWTRTIGEVGNEWGYSIQQTTDGGYIVCGTTEPFGVGSGDIWLIKLEADSPSVVDNEIRIVDSYSLEQNYPNPFNPSTKIKYSIPELSFVTFKVYDVLGNEIETLLNEEKPIGSYEVEFDARNLPSGIYFYRLRAGDFIETKKMILLK